MKPLTIVIVLFFPMHFLLMSCKETSRKSVNKILADRSETIKLLEIQMGKSDYYISIPLNYYLKETVGPDFAVYYFLPADTTIKPYFSGGIYFGGFPNAFEAENDSCKKEEITGVVLSKRMKWTVYNCEGKYTLQTIVDNGGWEKIHVFGTAASKASVDKVLNIYATMRKK